VGVASTSKRSARSTDERLCSLGGNLDLATTAAKEIGKDLAKSVVTLGGSGGLTWRKPVPFCSKSLADGGSVLFKDDVLGIRSGANVEPAATPGLVSVHACRPRTPQPDGSPERKTATCEIVDSDWYAGRRLTPSACAHAGVDSATAAIRVAAITHSGKARHPTSQTGLARGGPRLR
jgi:hypothetical protein